MHEMGVEWPCLSFDLIPDTLGFMRRTYPQTLYLVAGTQAVDPLSNRLVVMKVSNLTEMPKEEDDPFEEDDEDYIPIVKSCHIKLRKKWDPFLLLNFFKLFAFQGLLYKLFQ